MLEVDIDKILPVTEARDNFNKIIDEVEGTEHMYVLTKNGKPSAVVVGVNHLEKLTGKTADELTSIVEKKADGTPVVEEVKSEIPTESVGTTPTPLSNTNADGSTPPTAAAVDTEQFIQPGTAPVNIAPIDVPVDTEAPMPQVASAPAPPLSVVQATPSVAPTSSPGSAPLNVAPNQAPAAAPTDNGAVASDSDLFV